MKEKEEISVMESVWVKQSVKKLKTEVAYIQNQESEGSRNTYSPVEHGAFVPFSRMNKKDELSEFVTSKRQWEPGGITKMSRKSLVYLGVHNMKFEANIDDRFWERGISEVIVSTGGLQQPGTYIQRINLRALNKRVHKLMFGYYGLEVQWLSAFMKRCVAIRELKLAQSPVVQSEFLILRWKFVETGSRAYELQETTVLHLAPDCVSHEISRTGSHRYHVNKQRITFQSLKSGMQSPMDLFSSNIWVSTSGKRKLRKNWWFKYKLTKWLIEVIHFWRKSKYEKLQRGSEHVMCEHLRFQNVQDSTLWLSLSLFTRTQLENIIPEICKVRRAGGYTALEHHQIASHIWHCWRNTIKILQANVDMFGRNKWNSSLGKRKLRKDWWFKFKENPGTRDISHWWKQLIGVDITRGCELRRENESGCEIQVGFELGKKRLCKDWWFKYKENTMAGAFQVDDLFLFRAHAHVDIKIYFSVWPC